MASYKVYVCIDAPHLRLATLGAPSVQVSLKRYIYTYYIYTYVRTSRCSGVARYGGLASSELVCVTEGRGPFGAIRYASLR